MFLTKQPADSQAFMLTVNPTIFPIILLAVFLLVKILLLAIGIRVLTRMDLSADGRIEHAAYFMCDTLKIRVICTMMFVEF
jgi:hypothetical protein